MRLPSVHWYVLDDDGNPVPEPDMQTWGRWMASDEKVLARDEVGSIRVSTVFLGTDHNFLGRGPPILWETMVFGAPEPREILGREQMIHPDLGEHFDALSQRRYASRAAALAGHAEVLAAVHRLASLLRAHRPRQDGDDGTAQEPEPDQGGGLP